MRPKERACAADGGALRDFVFAPAKLYVQHRFPASFPPSLSNVDPRRASPRAHNLPEMALSGACAGALVGRLARRPHLGRATFTFALGATALQYAANEAYLQQIRYIRHRDAALLSRAPLVTARQRVKDAAVGVLDRFFGLGVAERIADADYLVEQEVRLDLLADEQARVETELARLELLYASLYGERGQ